MSNAYKILKERQQKEFNDFPMMFSFSDKQFEEGMEKLGLKKTDTDKVYSFQGGGFYRKTDAEWLREMSNRHSREFIEAIETDLTGEGFILDMFSYELANHEYGYTRDIEPTLDALGFTVDEINASEKLIHGLNLACKSVK